MVTVERLRSGKLTAEINKTANEQVVFIYDENLAIICRLTVINNEVVINNSTSYKKYYSASNLQHLLIQLINRYIDNGYFADEDFIIRTLSKYFKVHFNLKIDESEINKIYNALNNINLERLNNLDLDHLSDTLKLLFGTRNVPIAFTMIQNFKDIKSFMDNKDD